MSVYLMSVEDGDTPALRFIARVGRKPARSVPNALVMTVVGSVGCERLMTPSRRHWLLSVATTALSATERTLYRKLRRIADSTDGAVGAAALHLSSGAHVSYNGDERFPWASVCKVPIRNEHAGAGR